MRQVGGVETQYSQDPSPWVGNPQMRGYYNCKGSSQGMSGPSPTLGSPPRGLAPRRQAPRMFGFEGQWGLLLGKLRAIGKRDSTLGTHKASQALRPRTEAVI